MPEGMGAGPAGRAASRRAAAGGAPPAWRHSLAARQERVRTRLLSLAALLVVLAVAAAAACSVGSAGISFGDVWRVLLSRLPGGAAGGLPEAAATIVLQIRLPRILLAGLAGAALATAGATYQGLFRNPLADPYLIGVAQGAGLGAVVGFLLRVPGPLGLYVVPALSFCAALLVAGGVYALARVGRSLPMTAVILAGVAAGAFLSSITSFLLLRSGQELHGIVSWMLGGFSLSNWAEVRILLPYLAAGLLPLYLQGRTLNLLQLGEEQAQALGVSVERVKRILLLAATLITAAAVSFAGTIGFVGFILPHAVRLVWGPDYRFLLPLSTLAGAVFLIAADTLARVLLGTVDLPVGIVTAFLGAPFFLYLLGQRKKTLE